MHQCEQVLTENNNLIILNDEFEIQFFNRLYVCLFEKSSKIELLRSPLKISDLYFKENDDPEAASMLDHKSLLLETYKIAKKTFLNIKNQLDEPIFLKYHLLESFTNLLIYQHRFENFRKNTKSQIKCLYSILILNAEYKDHFKQEQLKCTKSLLSHNEQNTDKHFLDLIYQWIEVYGDANELYIDKKLNEHFSSQFFNFDNLNSFFKDSKNSAVVFSLYLLFLISKSQNFVELTNRKAILNTFDDEQKDLLLTLKENNQFAVEFYSVLIVNVLFNDNCLNKIQLSLEENHNDSMEREYPNKKYSIMRRLIDTHFIDSNVLALNFVKIFENLFEPSYYLFLEELLAHSNSDIEWFLEGL